MKKIIRQATVCLPVLADWLLYHIEAFKVFHQVFKRCNCMISVEVTETGVSLSKVASDMPRLAKAILKKAVTHAKGRAEQLTPVRIWVDAAKLVCN